jgi:hypothetical protein
LLNLYWWCWANCRQGYPCTIAGSKRTRGGH